MTEHTLHIITASNNISPKLNNNTVERSNTQEKIVEKFRIALSSFERKNERQVAGNHVLKKTTTSSGFSFNKNNGRNPVKQNRKQQKCKQYIHYHRFVNRA